MAKGNVAQDNFRWTPKLHTLAAPVEEGMMLPAAARPPRQSFVEGPSTVFCVAVVACTVVMRPVTMPNSSLSTLEMGASALVVQDALDTMFMLGSRLSWLTPMTNMGVSSFAGADIITWIQGSTTVKAPQVHDSDTAYAVRSASSELADLAWNECMNEICHRYARHAAAPNQGRLGHTFLAPPLM